MEGWGEGSQPGTQRVSQQPEVPPSSCTPCPPLGPPPGKLGVGPREETEIEEIELVENENRIEDERQIRDTAKETDQEKITDADETDKTETEGKGKIMFKKVTFTAMEYFSYYFISAREKTKDIRCCLLYLLKQINI